MNDINVTRDSKIICVHIGARAHYLLPRALESQGSLAYLITDTWIGSSIIRFFLNKSKYLLIKSFSNRYSNEIPTHKVFHFTLRFLIIECWLRFKYKNGWSLTLARNNYFQKLAITFLKRSNNVNALLGISYTSLHAFRMSKKLGLKTILYQMDPGLKEEEIVSDIVHQFRDRFPSTWSKVPTTYWSDWIEECHLADLIMVNSEWSKQGLTSVGIDAKKIKILPLPFKLTPENFQFERKYPSNFSKDRPLRCLFLGTLTLRKGIHLVIEVADRLKEYPIQFVLVGQCELDSSLLQKSNIINKGIASRSETDAYYRDSDVFLFPTLSDGFGLTQLESMAWKLPVIASKYCGKVVQDGQNGIILEECTSDELQNAILKCLQDVAYLRQLSEHCIETVKNYSLEEFSKNISKMINEE